MKCITERCLGWKRKCQKPTFLHQNEFNFLFHVSMSFFFLSSTLVFTSGLFLNVSFKGIFTVVHIYQQHDIIIKKVAIKEHHFCCYCNPHIGSPGVLKKIVMHKELTFQLVLVEEKVRVQKLPNGNIGIIPHE